MIIIIVAISQVKNNKIKKNRLINNKQNKQNKKKYCCKKKYLLEIQTIIFKIKRHIPYHQRNNNLKTNLQFYYLFKIFSFLYENY